MTKKNIIRYNFNLKISKQITRIKYSFFFKKYIRSVNIIKFLKFYNKLIKRKKPFKRDVLIKLKKIIQNKKITQEILKYHYQNNPFKKPVFKRLKIHPYKKKKIKRVRQPFKSVYYQKYLSEKKKLRKFFFFYLRKRNSKHSQHTNYLKFKNLFLKKGLVGRREMLFYRILMYLKKLMKGEKMTLTDLLKIVFKRLTFFCELKRKRKKKKEIFIPIPVSKRRGFFLGIKLAILNAKNRVENKSIEEKIALELFETVFKKSKTYEDLVKYNDMIKKNLDNIKLFRLTLFHYVD